MDGDVCPICHDAMPADGSRHRIAECGHAFHAACLISWLRTGGTSCPCCRADLEQQEARDSLDAFTLWERATHLRRTVARRRSVPAGLLRLVDRVRRAEAAAREAAQADAAFKQQHRELLSLRGRLRTNKWRSQRRVRDAKRLLGLYSDPDYPLPALVVHPRRR